MKSFALRVIAIVVCVVIMFGTFFQASERDGLAWWGENFPFISFIGTTVLLFIGIIFGTLFRTISAKRNKKINIVSEIRGVFTDNSFWTSVCVSPFVFFAVYAVIRASPSDPASYLLAFQNGFFCESVFKRLTDGDGSLAGETVGAATSGANNSSVKEASKATVSTNGS
jgi:hypothetical protein